LTRILFPYCPLSHKVLRRRPSVPSLPCDFNFARLGIIDPLFSGRSPRLRRQGEPHSPPFPLLRPPSEGRPPFPQSRPPHITVLFPIFRRKSRAVSTNPVAAFFCLPSLFLFKIARPLFPPPVYSSFAPQNRPILRNSPAVSCSIFVDLLPPRSLGPYPSPHCPTLAHRIYFFKPEPKSSPSHSPIWAPILLTFGALRVLLLLSSSTRWFFFSLSLQAFFFLKLIFLPNALSGSRIYVRTLVLLSSFSLRRLLSKNSASFVVCDHNGFWVLSSCSRSDWEPPFTRSGFLS